MLGSWAATPAIAFTTILGWAVAGVISVLNVELIYLVVTG